MANTTSHRGPAAQTGWDVMKYLTKDNVAFLALFVSFASFYTSWLMYDLRKADYQGRIDQIQFHAFYDSNWDVTLFQVAGDAYHLPNATFIPTFVTDGGFVRGTPYHANLAKYIEPQYGHPFYRIANMYEKLCERQKDDLCSTSTLGGIGLVYTVHGKQREHAVLSGE